MAKSIRAERGRVPVSAESRTSTGSGTRAVNYYLQQVMRGQQLADVPDNWRDTVISAMQFPTYQVACRVLDLAHKDDRRELISRQPESIRALVEAEVIRIWKIRQAQKA